MIWRVKIKAGAVQYVMVVSVVILIVLFAFISLVFLQNRLQAKSSHFKTTLENCYSGFDLLKEKDIAYGELQDVQFSNYDFEKTTLLKKQWGVFDLAIVSSKMKNEISTIVGLLAGNKADRKAIYLQDNNQPLKLVGNTKIIGDVLLPKRGVSTGNISGVSYYSDLLIYGKIGNNSGSLPSLKNTDHLTALSKSEFSFDVDYFNLESGQKIHQSFTKKTLLFESSSILSLDKMDLSGNIILSSSKKIIVDSSSELSNVILIAPVIIIKQGFTGTLQAIASKELVLEKNVSLHYPSALSLIDSDPQSKGSLTIEKGSKIKGMVIYYSDAKKGNYNAQVQIHSGATITGEVYCNQNLELLGTVKGSVYTSNFITRQSGGVYINHLYNARINAQILSTYYSGLFLGQTKNTVAKWVD